MKSILDRTFRYTPAAKTDIKRTFRRIAREQAEQKKAELEQIQKMPAQWARRA